MGIIDMKKSAIVIFKFIVIFIFLLIISCSLNINNLYFQFIIFRINLIILVVVSFKDVMVEIKFIYE